MKTGVMLLNFGEPERPLLAEVVPFLERIFTTNATLEGSLTDEQVRTRSAELARRRAASLIAEYEMIGGSPLNRQAREQAAALCVELGRRGHDIRIYCGMQFTDPTIRDAAMQAMSDGVERLVALPVYPLCGASTSVAALATLADTVRSLAWDVELLEVTGWHMHPLYTAIRAEGIRSTAGRADVALDGFDARLVFSAHGTPLRYLAEGSRYDLYVSDSCARIARAAGVGQYTIGFQNHTNRPVEWTQPEIGAALREVEARAVVVMPVSFMHEQSETMVELDIELRELAGSLGLGFHRVPVPYDDPRFAEVLADVVEARLGAGAAAPIALHACRCRAVPAACCTNALLERSA